MSQQPWGSDVRVSMPAPVGEHVDEVPMFGFVFTENGLFHDISEADHERLAKPTFAPISPTETVYDDEDVEG